MTRTRWLVFMLGLIGCGPAELALPPELAGLQPFVTAIAPEPAQTIAKDATIALTFSRPLAADSVHESSIVAYAAVASDVDTDAMQTRWEDELRGDQPLSFSLHAEGRVLQVALGNDCPSGRLALVITPAITSYEGFPFSQAPGISNRPYVLWFAVGDAASDDAFAAASGVASAEIPAVSSSTGSTPVPTAAAGTMAAPLSLVINEVLYDVPGEDLNGVLFVELRGTPDAAIGNYVIRFVNGDNGALVKSVVLPEDATMPADGLFVLADGMTGNLSATTVANADAVDNFDPQNGPDAVQLLAPDGELLDVLGYGTPLPLRDGAGLLLYEGTPGPDAPGGQSLSRLPDADDSDQNASDFVINTQPSPGTMEVVE